MAKEVWHEIVAWSGFGWSGHYFPSLEAALEKVPAWFANGHTKVKVKNVEAHIVVAEFVLKDGKIERII